LENPAFHFPDDGKELAVYSQRRIEGGITLSSLIKLAAFLAGEDAERRIVLCCDRLRLGTKARQELQSLCRCFSFFPPAVMENSGDRVLFRFFRDREPAGPELLVLPLADNAISPELAVRLVSYYFHSYRPAQGDLLLTGNQVMSLLGIGQGPELGRLMEALREAEALGHVATEAEAQDFLLKKQLTKEEPMG
jgi:poly(A) polymerase